MTRRFRIGGVLIAAATLLVLAVPVAHAQSVFTGTWTSTDLDGSNQTLWISGSGAAGRHAVSLFDDAASQACAGAPARAQGSGLAEDGVLMWSGTITCPGTGKGPIQGRVGLMTLMYDEGSDTLVDDSGVVWDRAS
jgi:hypothetical protein